MAIMRFSEFAAIEETMCPPDLWLSKQHGGYPNIWMLCFLENPKKSVIFWEIGPCRNPSPTGKTHVTAVRIQDGDHQRTQSLQHRLVLRETPIGRKDRGENLHLWQRPTGGADRC